MRSTLDVSTLDARPLAVWVSHLASYDRLVARYASDPLYAAHVAVWRASRDAVAARLAARPAVVYPPLTGRAWLPGLD